MTIFARVSRWLIITTLSCLCPFLLAPMAAYANGGAPQRAYIVGAAKGLGIINIPQQKVIGNMAIDGDPHMALLSLDGSYLYVTEPQLNRVAVIMAATGETFCTAPVPGRPTLLAIDPNANILFAAGNGASSVTSIDPENCKTKHTFQVDEPVYGLGVAAVATSLSPDSGNQLWVASSTKLTIFDDIKGTQIKQIPIPGSPRYISIPPGSAVYVTTQEGSVIAIDLNTYKVMTLISGGSYSLMDYNEMTGEIYVPDQKNQQLVALEPVSASFVLPKEPRRTIPLEVRPISVAITSDGQLAFVALEGGKVAMLDLPARQITNTFDVGGNPHFIITGLNPPVLSTTPQQTRTLQTVLTVTAYIIVAALLVVPIILFRRYAKAHKDGPTEQEQPSHTGNEDTANVQPEAGQNE